MRKVQRKSRVLFWAALALVFSAALGVLACAGGRAPVVSPELARAAERTTLVFVPGITGTELLNAESGEPVWGTGRNLIKPHDGGYALALPIGGEGDGEAESGLVAGEVIRSMRLFGLRKPIYGPVVELLTANGYRLGELANPEPGDSLYLFSYDWRRDNSVSARELFARLEAVRAARGVETLRVDLICQSNGAHICRYLTKYGDASLEDAAAGRAGAPATLTVGRLIMVGTANGGSMRILSMMNRGRSYVPFVGRDWLSESLFTLPSLYQDLPAYGDDLFIDPEGRALDVDLYDAASWRRYDWSIYGAKTAARLEDGKAPSATFGDAAARGAFLQRMLDRARLFQQALAAEVDGAGDTRYYLIQNRREATPLRAVLVEKRGRWRTLFTGDRAVRKGSELGGRATGNGDGHAAVESQLWLSPRERAAITREPFDIRGEHFEMILDRNVHRELLAILGDFP